MKDQGKRRKKEQAAAQVRRESLPLHPALKRAWTPDERVSLRHVQSVTIREETRLYGQMKCVVQPRCSGISKGLYEVSKTSSRVAVWHRESLMKAGQISKDRDPLLMGCSDPPRQGAQGAAVSRDKQ